MTSPSSAPGIVRAVRRPVCAGRGDEVAEFLCLAIAQMQPPPSFQTLGAHDILRKADVRIQALVAGKGADVIKDLPVRRIVGIIVRHGIARKSRHCFRRNEVGAAVHGAAGIFHVPDAARIAVLLKNLERNAMRHQRPASGKTGRARADYGGLLHAVCRSCNLSRATSPQPQLGPHSRSAAPGSP